MTIEKARRIQELRTGPVMHSLRRIAEIIEEEYPEYPDLSGNQLYGSDLVRGAMETLYNVNSINELPVTIRDEWDR